MVFVLTDFVDLAKDEVAAATATLVVGMEVEVEEGEGEEEGAGETGVTRHLNLLKAAGPCRVHWQESGQVQ